MIHTQKYNHNNELFFSIIIPCHNEEKYIIPTLDKIVLLNYPMNKIEIIIIENGSTDKTYQLLQKYIKKAKLNNLHLYQSEKGVSKAKNVGINKLNHNSDWAIFLDADTILETNFLNELNNFLLQNKKKNFSVGTTAILPLDDDSIKAKFWFKFYDLGHKLSSTSYAIQIFKTNIIRGKQFDENLRLSEDLKMIKEVKKYGKFFMFNSKSVFTSTRRFKEIGYFKLFCKWNYEALLPEKKRMKMDYKIIR